MKLSYLENGGTIVSGSEYRDVRTALRSWQNASKQSYMTSRTATIYNVLWCYMYMRITYFSTD